MMKRLLLPLVGVVLGSVAWLGATSACAEESSAPSDLETLVGPVALYPDDLLAIVLPAATFPLQIVEADRWLTTNKDNKDAEPKDTWDDSVKAMLNYPEVVKTMSADLEWTAALGEAVAADQTAVMDAVQVFRRKADGAGNLKTDEKQVIVVEKEVVKIVQADPEVIYVPQYQAQTVIVQQPAPVYPTYYPAPYPCYYSPGATFAAGMVWGATMAYAFDWHGGSIHDDIDIDIDHNYNSNRNVNRNVDRSNVSQRATNIDRGRSQQLAQSGSQGWQSKQRPSDVRQGRATPGTTRAAQGGRATQTQNRAASGGQVSNRAGANTSRSPGTARSSSTRTPGTAGTSAARGTARTSSASSTGRYNNAARAGNTARASPPSRDAFSGMSNSRAVGAQSARGASSRSSFGGGRAGGGRAGGGGRGGRRG